MEVVKDTKKLFERQKCGLIVNDFGGWKTWALLSFFKWVGSCVWDIFMLLHTVIL